MESHGDDLSRSRDIDFNVVFPDEARATAFAQQILEEGFLATARLEDVVKTHPWGVLVVRDMVPTHSGITQFENELEKWAEPLGGYTDGWGCISQPRPQ